MPRVGESKSDLLLLFVSSMYNLKYHYPGDQGPPAGSGTQAHWQELLGDSRGQRRSTRHAEATTQSRPAVGGSAPAIRGNSGPQDRWGVWQLISSDGEVPEEDTYIVTNPTAVILTMAGGSRRRRFQ